ncbi:Pseudouridine synthase family protein, partial [Prunus dulcis]
NSVFAPFFSIRIGSVLWFSGSYAHSEHNCFLVLTASARLKLSSSSVQPLQAGCKRGECFQFMSARPWQQVMDFYSDVVKDRKPLSALLGKACLSKSNIYNRLESLPPSQDKGGRWARLTFKIVVSYHGGSFDGWQRQPGLNTVQSVVEKSLGKFVDERKAQMLKDKGLPLEGAALVAGRTDKGVTAVHQDVKSQDITDAINSAAPGKLRVVSVTEEDMEQSNQSGENVQNFKSQENYHEHKNGCDQCNEANVGNLVINDNEDLETPKPREFTVSRVNQLLQKLEGKLLSYKMFARDTNHPEMRVRQQSVFSTMLEQKNPNYHVQYEFAAITSLANLVSSEHEKGRRVMCIELVANRFLRRMVRVLVATSIREAAAGADEDALLKLMDATCRRATAPQHPLMVYVLLMWVMKNLIHKIASS